MARFILRRLALALPTLFVIALFVFSLQALLPGDAATSLSGEDRDPAAIAAIRARYRLDDPLPIRFTAWLADLASGDFGVSIRTGLPIGQMLAQRIPVTLELALLAMLIALAIGVPAGIVSALKRGTIWDSVANGVALVGISVPNFWAGIMLILTFAVMLRWLPSGGFVSLSESVSGNLATLIMPAIVLSSATAAIVMRHTRSAMLTAMREDYIRTARAKGVPERTVVLKHAMRNALVPVITLGTLQFGELLAGAVLTEQVFGIPGFGKMLVDGVFGRDYAVVQAVVLCTAVGFLLMTLLADVLYFLVNPKLNQR